MSTVSVVPYALQMKKGEPVPQLAASVTRAASKQTYYTIRILVDQGRTGDAYRAYGYFRWLDDQLDQGGLDPSERVALVERQEALVDCCYRGESAPCLADEEAMLVELIRGDQQRASGLQCYIRNMMAVMRFDAQRRGRLVSQEELDRYTCWLAIGVTEALHHFIGHGCKSPHTSVRYLAVTAAHITHMLRDTLEDIEAGYINIPAEYVVSHRIDPRDVWSDPYRRWVQRRVQLASAYFEAGKEYLAQVENLRCRIAGYAYIARFEGVLKAIERDGYRLRAGYSECMGLEASLQMVRSLLGLSFDPRRPEKMSHTARSDRRLL